LLVSNSSGGHWLGIAIDVGFDQDLPLFSRITKDQQLVMHKHPKLCTLQAVQFLQQGEANVVENIRMGMNRGPEIWLYYT
jgi:hypothetical protein